MAHKRHINYLSRTIKYALNNPGRYATELLVYSQNFVCPSIPGIYVTDLPISPRNLLCPVYSWQIRGIFTYISPQLIMPCIFKADT